MMRLLLPHIGSLIDFDFLSLFDASWRKIIVKEVEVIPFRKISFSLFIFVVTPSWLLMFIVLIFFSTADVAMIVSSFFCQEHVLYIKETRLRLEKMSGGRLPDRIERSAMRIWQGKKASPDTFLLDRWR